jgi:chromosome segregation ATPase
MTPDQIRADDDDSDRVPSTFDHADNTARLALELAEAKREIERLRAEVESRGEQICSLVDRKAAIRARAEAAEAKVAAAADLQRLWYERATEATSEKVSWRRVSRDLHEALHPNEPEWTPDRIEAQP